MEISDASSPQKVDEFSVSLPFFPGITQIVPLRPRDAATSCQVSDESVVSIYQLDKMWSAGIQSLHPSLVQRQGISYIICNAQSGLHVYFPSAVANS